MKKLYKTWNPAFVKWMAKRHFAPPGKLLDLGCGDGATMEEFEKLGYKTKGCDIDPRIDRADKIDLEKDNLPYKNNYFDYMVCKWVIEHLNQAHKMLSETRRVLKPEGRICILTVDFSKMFRRFYNDFTHKRPYTKHSLEKLLEHHNFEVIEINNFGHLPFIWRWTALAFDLHFYPRDNLFALAEKP